MSCPVAGSRFARIVGVISADAILLGLLPFLYGILLVIYGEDVWDRRGGTYSTAMGVPGAPESVGVFLAIMGALILGANFFQKKQSGRILAIACFVMGMTLILMTTSFVVDGVVEHDEDRAVSPVLFYGILSALYVNKARLAWLLWKK